MTDKMQMGSRLTVIPWSKFIIAWFQKTVLPIFKWKLDCPQQSAAIVQACQKDLKLRFRPRRQRLTQAKNKQKKKLRKRNKACCWRCIYSHNTHSSVSSKPFKVCIPFFKLKKSGEHLVNAELFAFYGQSPISSEWLNHLCTKLHRWSARSLLCRTVALIGDNTAIP